MGFWSSAGSFFSNTYSAVKNIVEKGIDKCKSGVSAIKQGTTNVWNKFTGKDKIKEAQELYEKIRQKYIDAKAAFDNDSSILIDQIKNHVKCINKSKVNIKTQLFPLMADKLKQFADYDINQIFPHEEYVAKKLNIENIQHKSKLFKIDFDNHKFKTTVESILTLGFYTRKKASESLDAVLEQEIVVDENIKKMKAEVSRLNILNTSLSNIEFYFTTMENKYIMLLQRVACALDYLYVRNISFMHKVVRTQMKVSNLPRVQQKELEALDITSKILSAMVNMQVLDLHNEITVENIAKTIKKQYTEIDDILAAA
ncbi:hypothetical protein [Pectinatus sottacetonis]|uniref:hypothetical protein n=1 Tax=Pectinatus sottacetonis TaxID=1002795 RepID=UPI0018C78D30|nr:hypothetical protein [Pectinatus sottacetonis]